jgi:Protein of unknown function (DUF3800)
VRLVYMDEAGMGKASEERFMVVAGVVVHGDHQLNETELSLQRIAEKHIPAEKLDGFVFHAKELFNGGGLFDRDIWPLDKRLAIAREIAAIPGSINLGLMFGWVDLTKHHQSSPAEWSARNKTRSALLRSFLGCSALAESWMRRNASDENCIVVMEDDNQNRSLLAEFQSKNQDRRLIDDLNDFSREFFPYKHIREDPLFKPKRSHSPLEIADFCAFIWKRVLRAPGDERFLPFLDQMISQVWDPLETKTR